MSRLTRNAIVVAIVAIGALSCSDTDRNQSRSASNILLITIDTLRADHLSSYGYVRRTSRVIDQLAAEGVLFEQAWSQWPKTGPSFASIFTSTYPKDNGIVRKIGTPLPARFLMLAETLQRRGYTTHAVVSNGAVGSEFHFDQGFDSYVETWKLEEPAGAGDPNRAEVVNREVKRIVENMERSRPFFLWVHYLDPHFPYAPPPEFQGAFQDDEFFDPVQELNVAAGAARRQMGGIGEEQMLQGRTDLGFYIARYDEEIAYVDRKLGELLDFLRAEGLLDRTLTVLTADHGESLGEHRYFFDHGRFGFETCLRVPLIFHYPGRITPRVDTRPVELLDVAPTILRFAGVSLPEGRWMQGRTLHARLEGVEEDDDERGEYAHAEAGYATEGRWQKIVRDGRYKLIYVPFQGSQRHVGGHRQPFALFDVERDPGETVNLMGEDEVTFERLKNEMLTWWQPESFDVRVDVDDVEEEAEVSEETLEQLRDLGYIQ